MNTAFYVINDGLPWHHDSTLFFHITVALQAQTTITRPVEDTMRDSTENFRLMIDSFHPYVIIEIIALCNDCILRGPKM